MLKSLRLIHLSIFLCAAGALHAQLSSSAYRVLGQTGLSQSGLNLVQGVELYSPGGIALDTGSSPVHVYISDTHNSRVLAWQDVNAYQIGDPPTLILGQPSPQSVNPLGIGVKGFNAPIGLAVDPTTGNLYVADSGDNRVLRFPAPFSNLTRVEPDAVYGQAAGFTTAAGALANAMSQPRAVACDSAGNLWVADTGNNRVLRFAAGTLNSSTPPQADTVLGQKDFVTSLADQGGTVSASGLDGPAGLAFDAQNNLYVADFRNTRVLKFTAPGPSVTGAAVASAVWGQSGFSTKGVPQQATSSSMSSPEGLAVDGSGNLYVAVAGDNRVLVFPTASSGAAATSVLGQTGFSTTTANTSAFPQASAAALSAPGDVKLDQNGNIFIADTANNRVLEFPAGSKAASKVWGQVDFVSNGPNQVKPASINSAYQMAIDYSQAPFALYVSDTNNNRVLAWKDSVRFQSGDPADFVIGQPTLRTAAANADTGTAQTPTATSLSAPAGIAVNPADGTLYVADSGNNRVLRFPRPVAQQGRITADAAIGQTGLTSSLSAGVSASSLNTPSGVSIGPNGDLFVADTGNNRVLEFAAGPGTGASAVRVYGQSGMTASAAPSQPTAQTLTAPQGIFVDQAGNLYAADTGANRVLIFPNTQIAPPAGTTASFVLGQSNFTASSSAGFKSPVGTAVDSSGNIYVSDAGNNRVLIFASLIFLPNAGGTPTSVVGQPNLTSVKANWDGNGSATPDGLAVPAGIYIDRQDTLYVGDTGNNRVLQFLKLAVVVNAATFQTGVPVAPGGIATLGGAGLAGSTTTATGNTLPTSIADRQIVVNDQLAAPLYYLSPTQINFQVPSNSPLGTDRVAVRLNSTGELVAGGSLLVAAVSPGLFTNSGNGAGQAAVLNQDNSRNGAGNGAAAGSVIQLFGTGQGPVSPGVADGTQASSSPLSNTVAAQTSDAKTCLTTQPAVCVAIGSAFGTIQYSGLAPGEIGVWQINVAVPAGQGTGSVGVKVVIDGVTSNLATVTLK